MKRFFVLLLSLSLVLTFVSAAAYADTAATTQAQIVSSVSFRDQPSTSSNVMRYLKSGEQVTVKQKVNGYWYQVQDGNGVIGYVSTASKYISIVSNAQVTYGVNFRTGPTLDAAKIRMLPIGENVLVTEKVNDSWYKAQDRNGVVGYVSTGSKYLATDFSVTGVILPYDDMVEAVISAASKYMGTPYEFGSVRLDPTTFDCSDLVQQAFWDANKTLLPGDSSGQGDYVKSLGNAVTDWHNLKRGDLMFFMSYQGYRASDYDGINKSTQEVTHVGIYLGDGMVLQTYSPESGGVRTDSIVGNAWEYRFLFGGSAIQ